MTAVGSKLQRLADSDIDSDDEMNGGSGGKNHPVVQKREADAQAAEAGFGAVNPFAPVSPAPTAAAAANARGDMLRTVLRMTVRRLRLSQSRRGYPRQTITLRPDLARLFLMWLA
jgi:hypothetical protein